MDFHWIPLDSTGFHGFPPDSIGFYRIPRISTGFHWILPNSIGFEFRQNLNSDKIGTQTKSELRQNRDTLTIAKSCEKKKSQA